MVGLVVVVVVFVVVALCMRYWKELVDLEKKTRPRQEKESSVLKKRWDELPEHVKTPNQILGRATMGCEGTHSVFPKCNLTCKPCYHSRDANLVRVDGPHTLQQVRQQMHFMKERRGDDGVHCQLIGGEVSLLSPHDHAQALQVMLDNARIPMSFTNGDFDYEYLKQLASPPHRFARLNFAAHFDKFMYGRRQCPRPKSESDLHSLRAEFCQMFLRLKREGFIRSFHLAHNMTVTPGNVDEVSDVIRQCYTQGWSLMSHQPAAYVGDDSRWTNAFRHIDPDDVWRRIEEGVGRSLPYRVFQMGDERCNRSVWGFWVGDRYFPFLEEEDCDVRDAYLERVGVIQLSNPNVPVWIPLIRAVRMVLFQRHVVSDAILLARYVGRMLKRIGWINLLTKPIRRMTFVMHNFMDADVVKEAYELNRNNVWSEKPHIREAQERLKACSYTFGHPDRNELVPGCVQHSVLDPAINAHLKQVLPLKPEDLEW